MPISRRSTLLALPLLLTAASTWAPLAAAADDASALPPQVELAGAPLLRNGVGVRRFLLFKVYRAALYLQQPARSTGAVLQQPGPKLMRLVLLRRVDASELVAKMEAGIRANVDAAQLPLLNPAIARLRGALEAGAAMSAVAPGSLQPGQVLDLAWTPASGTVLRLDGRALGAPDPEPGLYPALLQVWLGAHPVDRGLKRELLGD